MKTGIKKKTIDNFFRFISVLLLSIVILVGVKGTFASSYSSGVYGDGVYGGLDVDRDGIEDYKDFLLYDRSYVITTGVTYLNISAGGRNESGVHVGREQVEFFDGVDVMVNFSHNFSASSVLDLSRVQIHKTAASLVVNFSGQVSNKTLYLEDDDFIELCAKDDEISTIAEISSGCDGLNETDFDDCIGNTTGLTLNGITCTDEGTRFKFENFRFSAVRGTPRPDPIPPVVNPPGSGGGGGGGGGGYDRVEPIVKNETECENDIDCKKNQYCFENKCHDAECFEDSDCGAGETCWNRRCVKLFDVEIIEFQSPIKVGEYFNFTYLVYGRADINRDIEINFWVENEGEIISSGMDTLYLASFEEKIKTSKLFLPSNIDSGIYKFFIKIKFGTYEVEAHRTIQIIVEEDGTASINLLPEPEPSHIGIIIGLIVASLLIVYLIFYFKRKKNKSKNRKGKKGTYSKTKQEFKKDLHKLKEIFHHDEPKQTDESETQQIKQETKPTASFGKIFKESTEGSAELTDKVIPKKIHKFLQNVSDNKIFLLHDGRHISNLTELNSIISTIPIELFFFHHTKGRDDFYNWIFYVVGDKVTANIFKQSKSLEEIRKRLRARVEYLKHKKV